MKKTLLAVAAVACCSAAFAQSTVTLYGVIDVSVGSKTGGKFAFSGGKDLNASYHTPTRFGLRGSEDLGGGLKANFNLETNGIGMATGSLNGNMWGREAWTGLSGNFGSTRLGRTSSFGTQSHARFDLNGISTSSAMDVAGISPVTWYGSSRRDAQIQYVTPNMGGFDAGVSIVLAGNNANKQSTSVRANYGAGPLAVGVVAETSRTATNRTAYAIAGSYDLGMAKLVGGYVVSETVAKGKGAYIGAVAPMGPVNVGAQYARNTAAKVNATELFANYSLSKRTSLYADFVKRSGSGTTGTNSYGLGVLHTF